MYIARDKSGALWLFTKKPKRMLTVGMWWSRGGDFLELDKDDASLPHVTWEDEPIKVTINKDGTQQD